MNAFRLLQTIVLGMAILTAGCGKPSTPDDPVLATVGDQVITVKDYNRELERRLEEGRPIASKEALLDEMVQREAALYRARTTKLASDPEVKRMMENLLMGQLRDRELEAKLREAEVTDEDLEKLYHAEIDRFKQKAKTRLAIIKINSAPTVSESKSNELNTRIAEARARAMTSPPPGGRGAASQGFGEIAIDYSEDQASRYRGGDIGWLDTGRLDYHWPRPVLETGYALEKGEISDVIKADHALYLVKKTDDRPGTVKTFEEVKSLLRPRALAKKRSFLQQQFQEENLELARVDIREAALDAISLPLSAKSPEAIVSTPPPVPGSGN